MGFGVLACASVVTVLGCGVASQASGANQAMAAESEPRTVVDKSIDPDGFLLNPAHRRSAAELPSVCVSAEDEHPEVGLARVVIRNECPSPQRVKVIIAFWFDSACLVVPSGGTREYEYANSARFDGLEAC